MKLVIARSRRLRNRGALSAISPLLRSLAAESRPSDGFVAVNWIGSRAMAVLNARFRGSPKAAEILTFPAAENLVDPSGEIPRGEIYLCWAALSAGARRRGVPARAYAARLFVHGLFHLRGYRHDTEGRAEEMERAERRFLRGRLPARVLDRLFD